MQTQLISSRFLRNIPEEIICDILSRLPVQSLLRIRCVCKVWKSLISDPKFTLSSPNHQIAIKFGNLYSIGTGHDLSRTISLPRGPLLKQMLFFFYDENKTKRLNILDSCNGLFLVSHNVDLYLWNPSTRESTKVLSLRTKRLPENFSISFNPSGLCYDSSTDDYKAVVAKDFGKAIVVSFKRKYLTTATFHAGDNDYVQPHSGLVVNQKLHWAITSFGDVRATRSWIVSFNPLTDEFEEFLMPLLPDNGEEEPIIQGLGVLNGCLCMTRCVGGDEVGPGFFELLVMKEYGVGGSWTRIFKASKDFTILSRGDLVPLCFTSDGEVVISSIQLNKLCAYNLEDMSHRNIMIPSKGHITYQTSYAKSLVSPAIYGHEDWIVERLREFAAMTIRLWKH